MISIFYNMFMLKYTASRALLPTAKPEATLLDAKIAAIMGGGGC